MDSLCVQTQLKQIQGLEAKAREAEEKRTVFEDVTLQVKRLWDTLCDDIELLAKTAVASLVRIAWLRCLGGIHHAMLCRCTLSAALCTLWLHSLCLALLVLKCADNHCTGTEAHGACTNMLAAMLPQAAPFRLTHKSEAQAPGAAPPAAPPPEAAAPRCADPFLAALVSGNDTIAEDVAKVEAHLREDFSKAEEQLQARADGTGAQLRQLLACLQVRRKVLHVSCGCRRAGVSWCRIAQCFFCLQVRCTIVFAVVMAASWTWALLWHDVVPLTSTASCLPSGKQSGRQ